MKILLLGMNGQLGWELQRALAPLGELVALGRTSGHGLSGDLNDMAGLSETVRAVAPGVIVNAAAYTAVDRAEREPEAARRINAEAPATLAAEAARSGAWLVHYSSDYVFDGRKSVPYRENDAPAPLSVYGASKLAGERAISDAGCRHLTFRTSWVFAARGRNFADTMLRLARERDDLRVIADQIGAPTSAELIADVTALCLFRLHHDSPLAARASGLYHLSATGQTSWHGYAQHLIRQARQCGMRLRATADDVHPVSSADYPQTARRPSNSRLDCAHLQHTFGLALPHWTQHLNRMIMERSEREQT